QEDSMENAGGDMSIERMLHSMDLRKKVGQMVVVGFPEPFEGEVPAGIQQLVRDPGVGGVGAFARNARTPESMKALTSALQDAAQAVGAVAPLLIMADQEGGIVMQVTEEACVFPGNMAIGATGNSQYAYEAAHVMGTEALAMGINTVCAPVVDVNAEADNPIIGLRAFGDDPGEVSRLGEAMIRGYADAGVLCVAKHFPGHGRTRYDTHEEVPTVQFPREDLEEVDLAPFKAAIAAGAPMVMTAHIRYPSLSGPAAMPATLSREILTELLRREMQFNGIVITDCLEMKAIKDNFGPGEAAARAIRAGADIVLMCHTLAVQKQAIEAVLAAVERGAISQQQIDESVRRILSAKTAWIPGFDEAQTGYGRPLECVGCEAHRRVEQKLAQASITVVRNNQGLLPLAPSDRDRYVVVYPATMPLLRVEDLCETSSVLGQVIRARCPHTKEVAVPLRPGPEDTHRAVTAALEADVVVVATSCKTPADENAQASLVKALVGTGKPVVALAIRNPYDLRAYPEVQTYLVTYGYRECSMRAAADVIFGAVRPQGKLPVTIPGMYPRGHGIQF
ncbi:MAG: glycoside hydrolase family 3 N-terminal domain-containing protein, partial [Bacillota bacterium]